MAVYIAIPKLGMTMRDARLVEWKAEEGALVNAGDIVLTIETDKTLWEVEATAAGYLHILVRAEQQANVARVVGLIAENEEELAQLQKQPPQEIYTTDAADSAVTSPVDAPAADLPAAAGVKDDKEKRVMISPVAKKMAVEHMIDITALSGSGPGGRILREDVERAIEEKKKAPAEAKAPSPAPSGKVINGKQVKEAIPLTGMRGAIAEHMYQSLQVAAQATGTAEVDMTEIIKLRNLIKDREKIKVTYSDILVLIIAKALRAHPIINSSIVEKEIVMWQDINIGIAVAVTGGANSGLIVPVVKNADKKTLVEISDEIKILAEKARLRKLLPDDVSGGTFTFSNPGALGGFHSYATPIINQPESAILAMSGITDRPVVRYGQIVIRPITVLSFTFDHRAIDGVPSQSFLSTLIKLIENPGLLIL